MPRTMPPPTSALIAGLLALAALGGCGGTTTDDPEDPKTWTIRGACHIAKNDSITCDTCEELTGPTWGQPATLANTKASCESTEGRTWLANGCSLSGVLNRCVHELGKDPEMIVYTYAGCSDAAKLEATCSSMGGVTQNK
ncbi:MAG: hypothetical protein HY901_14605 [Deltaproteobacteria bacterium]|nr:hypothetical protein [Deltaproteobacteria bacterium]